jgi:hypothetical protein
LNCWIVEFFCFSLDDFYSDQLTPGHLTTSPRDHLNHVPHGHLVVWSCFVFGNLMPGSNPAEWTIDRLEILPESGGCSSV